MRFWTKDETELARQMIARGEAEAAFLTRFGKKKSAACRVDRLKCRPKTRACPNTPTSGRIEIPDQVKIEAAKRASSPRSLTALVCGDPPSGYTQLDRRGS